MQFPYYISVIRFYLSVIFFMLLCGKIDAQFKINSSDTLLISFLSDTQGLTLIENLFLKSNHNSEATDLIYNDILIHKPEALFHLGDLVSSPFIPGAWNGLDSLTEIFRSNNISFYPIPGNHEYVLFPSWAVSIFKNRFPQSHITGYKKQIKDLAVILLNSNIEYMSGKDVNAQLKWYRKTLTDCEADTSVKYVIVACHHPPYTNSTIVDPSKYVREYFLPDFIGANKTKLFLSGHSHSFEHFTDSDKDILVIGGGGGLQQPLKTGTLKKYDDIYVGAIPVRMFHYLNIKRTDTSLIVEIEMLKNDFSGFETIPVNIYH